MDFCWYVSTIIFENFVNFLKKSYSCCAILTLKNEMQLTKLGVNESFSKVSTIFYSLCYGIQIWKTNFCPHYKVLDFSIFILVYIVARGLFRLHTPNSRFFQLQGVIMSLLRICLYCAYVESLNCFFFHTICPFKWLKCLNSSTTFLSSILYAKFCKFDSDLNSDVQFCCIPTHPTVWNKINFLRRKQIFL